jgi:hypothetical protein
MSFSWKPRCPLGKAAGLCSCWVTLSFPLPCCPILKPFSLIPFIWDDFDFLWGFSFHLPMCSGKNKGTACPEYVCNKWMETFTSVLSVYAAEVLGWRKALRMTKTWSLGGVWRMMSARRGFPKTGSGPKLVWSQGEIKLRWPNLSHPPRHLLFACLAPLRPCNTPCALWPVPLHLFLTHFFAGPALLNCQPE